MKKTRKRSHRDVRHRRGGILPPTAVWEALEALAKTAEQGAQALHLDVESYRAAVSQSPQPRCRGFFPNVAISPRRSPRQPCRVASKLTSASHCKCDSSALRTAANSAHMLNWCETISRGWVFQPRQPETDQCRPMP